MATANPPLSEAQLYAYLGDHPEVVGGLKYHRSPLGSAKYQDELMIPFAAKAFSPAALLRQFEKRMGGEPPKPTATRESDAAAWFVDKLVSIAECENAPATARLGALDRIRGIMATCLVALHPPLAESLSKAAPEEEPPSERSHVAEFLARKAQRAVS